MSNRRPVFCCGVPSDDMSDIEKTKDLLTRQLKKDYYVLVYPSVNYEFKIVSECQTETETQVINTKGKS